MDIKTAAKNNKISERFIYMLLRGERKTNDLRLASEVAKINGSRPSIYLSAAVKSLALEIHPELGMKTRKDSAQKL